MADGTGAMRNITLARLRAALQIRERIEVLKNEMRLLLEPSTVAPTREELLSIVDEAIERFMGSTDCNTLLRSEAEELEEKVREERNAHEQAISHRLAFYLEAVLRDRRIVTDGGPLSVDCEYNLHLFRQKEIYVSLDWAKVFLDAARKPVLTGNLKGYKKFRIRPDILLHQRGKDGPTNLLVVEVKRSTNRERALDEAKLRFLTESRINKYRYALALAVYITGNEPKTRELEVGLRYHEGRPF